MTVTFDKIDPEEEEDRTNRGYEHRKDLVRGIKFQKENDERMKGALAYYMYSVSIGNCYIMDGHYNDNDGWRMNMYACSHQEKGSQ